MHVPTLTASLFFNLFFQWVGKAVSRNDKKVERVKEYAKKLQVQKECSLKIALSFLWLKAEVTVQGLVVRLFVYNCLCRP